ncbi:DedA family protein [Thiobacillus sedimenti]|uniref:DedA family protein n=1 Tax=Thiobacillus sedimenti TaxID=3110231 RepID=A0ABZ1CI09_9PROT|nr:DedA family protein [Thiobacillus sp. SCUT-2]WRS39032.1 DedA family protein [Thiobacillus sp. SCUT-2]
MDLPTLIAHYGYAAVLVGAVFEGETVLLLAGYAAHRGYLDFAAVTGLAWLGAVAGDQFFFWLGRRHGQRLLERRPVLRGRVAEAFALIERHPVAIILTMRFLWGLRMALPIAIGLGRVPWRRFAELNALSAALWAPLVAGLGWSFGALLAGQEAMLHHYEHWVMAALAVAALLLRAAVRRRRRHPEPKR